MIEAHELNRTHHLAEMDQLHEYYNAVGDLDRQMLVDSRILCEIEPHLHLSSANFAQLFDLAFAEMIVRDSEVFSYDRYQFRSILRLMQS